MAHRHSKTPSKTFQQRQTERHQRDLEQAKDRAIVEEMASKYSCSNGVALDFAGQCEERLVDVDFDLLCSDLALGFWADPPEPARPVVDLLRELAAERRRYHGAITEIRTRLLALTKGDPVHHHLPQPIEHYEAKVRDRLFPKLELRPVQNRAASGDR
jgi:hypothetical protein